MLANKVSIAIYRKFMITSDRPCSLNNHVAAVFYCAEMLKNFPKICVALAKGHRRSFKGTVFDMHIGNILAITSKFL